MKVVNDLDIKEVLKTNIMSADQLIALFQEQLQDALQEIKEEKAKEEHNRVLKDKRTDLIAALVIYIECLLPGMKKLSPKQIEKLKKAIEGQEEQIKKFALKYLCDTPTSRFKYTPMDEDEEILFNFISNNV